MILEEIGPGHFVAPLTDEFYVSVSYHCSSEAASLEIKSTNPETGELREESLSLVFNQISAINTLIGALVQAMSALSHFTNEPMPDNYVEINDSDDDDAGPENAGNMQ